MKIGFCSILTIIFVIAKITGHIDWSWWLVFLPMILGAALVTFCLAVTAFLEVRDSREKEKRLKNLREGS